MKKEQLLKLYEDYLHNNPQNIYIKNVKGSFYSNQIDQAYIQDNNGLSSDEIPEYLTFERLRKIDEEHNHTLKWKILESDVTDEKIEEFEHKNKVTLPKMFREYLQGYTILQKCFYPKYVVSEEIGYQGYYDQNTGKYERFSDKELEQDEELIGNLKMDFFGICNPNDTLSLGYFENIGMIQLGNLDNGDIVLLDCETGTVQSWDHETMNAWEAESKEEFEEESSEGDFWFETFDDFLEWLFGKTIYIYSKKMTSRIYR